MGALFWGIIIVIIGLSIILKAVFNFDLPVFKIFIAFIFIYIGFKVLLRDSDSDFDRIRSDEETVIFGEKNYHGFPDEGKEYNVIFGGSKIDLRDIELEGSKKYIKISTVFGSTVLKLNEDLPYKVTADVVFSDINLPDRNKTVIGSNHYKSKNYNPDEPYLDIRVDVVFGSFKIREY